MLNQEELTWQRAILEDIAKNLKLEGTYNMLKDYVKAYREQNTAISTAHKYVSEHTDEAILAYVGILQSLAEEFESRQFVLIFDNFESTGRASFDFLINFILRLPTGFHIIVAFKTERAGIT